MLIQATCMSTTARCMYKHRSICLELAFNLAGTFRQTINQFTVYIAVRIVCVEWKQCSKHRAGQTNCSTRAWNGLTNIKVWARISGVELQTPRTARTRHLIVTKLYRHCCRDPVLSNRYTMDRFEFSFVCGVKKTCPLIPYQCRQPPHLALFACMNMKQSLTMLCSWNSSNKPTHCIWTRNTNWVAA